MVEEMRQLIARIDDALHARLKARAQAEGRSMNALVNELLQVGATEDTPSARLKAKLRAKGMLVEPPPPERVPTWEEVEAAGRGSGTAVSEALEEHRASR